MAEDKKDIILSIRGMSKSFGRNKVLKHIDLDVKKGSIMGLMGENGAGKSTMMNCLFGTFQKDEGTIILDGKEINFTGPKDALENSSSLIDQISAPWFSSMIIPHQPAVVHELLQQLASQHQQY